MNYQQIREKHFQFYTTMFIATFVGAIFLTAAGHFLIGSFGVEKLPGQSTTILISILVVAGLFCYVLPWVMVPFAREALQFWFKDRSVETQAGNLLPYLILSCTPFIFASLPVALAIDAGARSYQGPLFVGGAFAFFGMSLLQSFLPLRVYFRKTVSGDPLTTSQQL